jgi:hypothetical protein
MKRIAVSATAFLLFLACTIPVVNGQKIQPKPKGVDKTSHSSTPTVTLVLRGLMVIHPDPAREYFEAGILKAPGHQFRVEVREKTSAGVSKYLVPLPPFTDDAWSLEFTSPTKRGVSLYQSGAFDRKAGIGDPRDFRWAVDIEGTEFYNEQVKINENQLGPIVRVTSGEFYTKDKSRPVMRRQGDGTFQLFGSIAEEIAADYVTRGDVVLRSVKSGKEILRLPAKPATTYEIILENQPVTEGHMAGMASSSDHFQYYYHVIAKPKTEWFEFKIADPTLGALGDSNQFRVIAASYVSPPPAPDPATCGLLGLLKRIVGLR